MRTTLGISQFSEPGQLVAAIGDASLNRYPNATLRSLSRSYNALAQFGTIHRRLLHEPGGPLLFIVTVDVPMLDEPVQAEGLCLHTAVLRALSRCVTWLDDQVAQIRTL